jgi:hypothetical protein
MRVRNRISNRLLNSPLRGDAVRSRASMSAEIARKQIERQSCPNIVLTVFLANLRELKRAACLVSRYLTLNCVDAMFVRATVL